MVNQPIVNCISCVSLDLVIVAALGTLLLTVIVDNFIPFLLLATAGAAWNIAGFLYLAPKLIPGPWFERGIPSFGQSMGMTITGLMLFQLANPQNKSESHERFGNKQMLFEPVVRGGIFSAMSLPRTMALGAGAFLALVMTESGFGLKFGMRIAKRPIS